MFQEGEKNYPLEDFYKVFQKEVFDYSKRVNLKIGAVGQKFGIKQEAYLYKILDPKQPDKKATVDLVGEFTTGTGILNPIFELNRACGLIAFKPLETEAKIKGVGELADDVIMKTSELFSTTKESIKNKELSAEEKRRILEGIHNARTELAKLNHLVENTEIDTKDSV